MKKIIFILSVLLFAYIVVRAALVPFTHDEAWTYSLFVKAPVWEIVTAKYPVANNHILNTLLAKFFSIFSDHEFVLRLPNVLSFALYLYAVYRIAVLLFAHKWFQLCFFMAMIANDALLDFFSLCRGYGLGIGLLTFSIYQLIYLIKQPGKDTGRKLHLCMLSSVLAVYANFALLNPVLGIFLGICIQQYYTGGRQLLSAVKLPFIYGLLLAALCAYPLWRIINAHELYYGGENNFIDDTLLTMADDMAGYWVFDPLKRDFFMAPFVALIALSIVIAFYHLRPKSKPEAALFVAPMLLLVCIASVNTQFYLLHTKLVIYRTALYLFPLIILSVFSAAAMFSDRFEKMRIIGVSVICAPLVFFLAAKIHFTLAPREWWFDSYSKKVLAFIASHSESGPSKKHLFSNWLMANSLNYYIDTRSKYNSILEVSPIYKEPIENLDITQFDYLFLRNSDENSQLDNFTAVQSYDHGHFLLYQKKQEVAP